MIQLGATRWHTRRECALRSAGFPVTLADRLCDEELAAIADACADQTAASPEFTRAYDRACGRLAGTIRELAADSRLREAMIWQNADVVRNCLDKIRSGRPLPGRVWRQYVLTIASYVQRYAMKNDTIGFFGPLGWADLRSGELAAEPGRKLLARRSVYFECWAIDAIAREFSRDGDIFPWCAPRLAENLLLLDGVLYSPRGSVVALAEPELELLSRCDGERPVREIAADPLTAARLRSLADRGLVHLDLTGPLEARPEITLHRKLAAIGDPAVRARALAVLDGLVAARDRVAGAAGDPDRLAAELDGLGAAFEHISSVGATRRHGEMYAGRTLVYEDTRRDVEVTLGTSLLDRIAEPLSLVLESAQWLAGRAAELYESRLAELYHRCRTRVGTGQVPLALLVAAATPDLAYSAREQPPLVGVLIGDFQRRWASVLRLPVATREHAVTARAVGRSMRAAFPASPPRWSSAIHHAPDVMIAVRAPGDLLAVLGEVHVAVSTLSARPVVEMHDNPAELMAAEVAAHGRRRIVAVPSKDARYVNSRTYPPALLSPQFTYWTMHTNITGAPGRVLPVADLTVIRAGSGLVVHSRSTGAEFDLLEMFGEYLSGAIVNSFQPIAPARHCPRVLIDTLVISRESWTFTCAEMDWCLIRSEQARYRRARQWRRSLQLPERVFFRIEGEDKPIFCDFTSIPFMNLLARSVRKGARVDASRSVTLTEMLPGADHAWLRDADGAPYTAELRMIFTDPDDGLTLMS